MPSRKQTPLVFPSLLQSIQFLLRPLMIYWMQFLRLLKLQQADARDQFSLTFHATFSLRNVILTPGRTSRKSACTISASILLLMSIQKRWVRLQTCLQLLNARFSTVAVVVTQKKQQAESKLLFRTTDFLLLQVLWALAAYQKAQTALLEWLVCTEATLLTLQCMMQM